MSQHLHIPLSRQRKTTRPSRRVVWLLVIFLVVLTATIIQLFTLWFTRNTVFVAAPEDTHTAVQILVNSKTIPVLQSTIQTIPLISHRDLTIDDILPFTHGEIGWFFHNDGTRSLAIRTNASELPTTQLDAKHIVVQKIRSNIFLLSEKLQPIKGFQAKRSFSDFIPSLSTPMGVYMEKDWKRTSSILSKNNKLSLRLPANSFSIDTKPKNSVPKGTFLYLSTPVLSNTDSIFNITQIFSGLTDPILGKSIQTTIEEIMKNHGQLLLVNKEQSSYLIASQTQMPSAERVQLIRTILALKHPTMTTVQLDDGTSIQEIIADASLIPIEEKIITGKAFYRATTDSASILISKDGEFILSDNEDTILSWLQPDSNNEMLMPCDTNSGFFFSEKLLDPQNYPTAYYTNDFFYQLAQHFDSFGIEISHNKSKINLCI